MYKHTQFGTVIFYSIGGFFIATLVPGFLWPELKAAWPVSGIMFVVLLLFYDLTVTVNDGVAKATFGIGLVSKKVQLVDVVSVEAVRNHWIVGFGIRYLGKRTWLFNVSGLDAIQFVLKDGRRVQFGTDDTIGLLAALEPYQNNA